MGELSVKKSLLVEDAAKRALCGIKCLLALSYTGESEIHDAINFVACGLLKYVTEIKDAISS